MFHFAPASEGQKIWNAFLFKLNKFLYFLLEREDWECYFGVTFWQIGSRKKKKNVGSIMNGCHGNSATFVRLINFTKAYFALKTERKSS